MKNFYVLLLLSFSCFTYAQIPAGYYVSINTTSGAALKTSLYNIIKGHTVRTYANLWTDFQSTDKKADGKVWEIYAGCDFIFGAYPAGNQDIGSLGGSACQVYNREHTMPKSWFGVATPSSSSPPSTDLFHILPADKNANSTRNDYPYSEVGTATKVYASGSKYGASSFPGFSGTSFEPIDEYKGDLARGFFYMATRYEDVIASWKSFNDQGSLVLNATTHPAFETWVVNLLAKWHQQDPVSQKEIDRNNAIYALQHNRNPYIDHPEFAGMVWGFATIPGVITVDGVNTVPGVNTTGGENMTVGGVNTTPGISVVNVLYNLTLTGARGRAISGKLYPGAGISIMPFMGTLSENGSLVLNGDGTFSYIPSPAFTGLESYSFTGCDAQVTTCVSGLITFEITTSGVASLTGLNVGKSAVGMIYPNPVSSYLVIDYPFKLEPELEVYNALGVCVFRQKGLLIGGKVLLPDLPAGFYMLRATQGAFVWISRFQKVQ